MLSLRTAAAAARRTIVPRSAWNSSRIAFSTNADHMGTYDDNNEFDRIGHGDHSKREFTYLMLGTGRFLYATTARLALLRFVSSMSASADVLALASMEMDLSPVDEGTTVTVKWRGKPVFVRHRNSDEIGAAQADDGDSSMRDQEPDSARVMGDPKWLIVLGVCTHLGCVPLVNAGEYNGWYCPCHGSHYDTSGRIRKGPAPLNLEVPPYSFMDSNTVKIG
jgi:ubiquinol-cytochrome c reductase iron-sulfur subunit